MVRNGWQEDLPENSRRPAFSPRRDDRIAQSTYGYHNTFHTHAQPSITESDPPSYEHATSPSRFTTSSDTSPSTNSDDLLPEYSCTIEHAGIVAVRCELASPFLESCDSRWHDTYVILHGPQLDFHKVKSSGFGSKNKRTAIGRLIRTYSLQHAEVGVAVDWKKSELVPKNAFAKLVPAVARQRLWETDPELFEPIREWVLRLRLEGEQLLICAESQDAMLTWVEQLCAAIDIAPPLEDRCEPRYRSLPRRNRRQREIEGVIDHLDNLQDDEAGRRFIEQQERLIRRLYPHLAREGSSTENHPDPGSRYPASSNEPDFPHGASHDDPDAEDLDPADVTEGSHSSASRPPTSSPSTDSPAARSSESDDAAPSAPQESFNPKTAPPRAQPTQAAQLRYRKRCAPVLLNASPRASEVIFHNNQRVRIDPSRNRLVPFEMAPPLYEVGSYKKIKPFLTLASVLEDISMSPIPARPALGVRGISESSYLSNDASYSFDDELHHAHSGDSSTLHTNGSSSDLGHSLHLDGHDDLHIDRIDSAQESVESAPPSPVPSELAGKTKGKAILVVRRVKEQHSTDTENAMQNAQLPLVV